MVVTGCCPPVDLVAVAIWLVSIVHMRAIVMRHTLSSPSSWSPHNNTTPHTRRCHHHHHSVFRFAFVHEYTIYVQIYFTCNVENDAFACVQSMHIAHSHAGSRSRLAKCARARTSTIMMVVVVLAAMLIRSLRPGRSSAAQEQSYELHSCVCVCKKSMYVRCEPLVAAVVAAAAVEPLVACVSCVACMSCIHIGVHKYTCLYIYSKPDFLHGKRSCAFAERP